ncbi:MAG: hypothetical protein P4L49_18090 [Desulfosporosinus sp.]|nr:hypothetical protein [Desulfosporosinus sp.]
MEQPRKITEYLEAVRQQIRWKKAQSPVLEEIKNQIIDQKNAFVIDGLNEEEFRVYPEEFIIPKFLNECLKASNINLVSKILPQNFGIIFY